MTEDVPLLIALLIALVAFNAIPVVVYGVLARHPAAWAPIFRTPITVARGSYRTAFVTPPPVVGRAPVVARIAAYLSLALGQLILPQLFVCSGLAAAFLFDATRWSPTTWCRAAACAAAVLLSVLVGWKLFVAGGALVCRDHDAARRARNVARASLALAAAASAGTVALAAARDTEEGIGALAAVVLGAYATALVANAALLFRAARSLEQM